MTVDLTKMLALCTMESASDEMIATGNVDASGVPVFTRKRIVIPSGKIFMATAEQREDLIRSGVAEEVES